MDYLLGDVLQQLIFARLAESILLTQRSDGQPELVQGRGGEFNHGLSDTGSRELMPILRTKKRKMGK
jgi:hypothetical protein